MKKLIVMILFLMSVGLATSAQAVVICHNDHGTGNFVTKDIGQGGADNHVSKCAEDNHLGDHYGACTGEELWNSNDPCAWPPVVSVPEFTTVGAGLVFLGAGAAFAWMRRKNN